MRQPRYEKYNMRYFKNITIISHIIHCEIHPDMGKLKVMLGYLVSWLCEIKGKHCQKLSWNWGAFSSHTWPHRPGRTTNMHKHSRSNDKTRAAAVTHSHTLLLLNTGVDGCQASYRTFKRKQGWFCNERGLDCVTWLFVVYFQPVFLRCCSFIAQFLRCLS